VDKFLNSSIFGPGNVDDCEPYLHHYAGSRGACGRTPLKNHWEGLPRRTSRRTSRKTSRRTSRRSSWNAPRLLARCPLFTSLGRGRIGAFSRQAVHTRDFSLLKEYLYPNRSDQLSSTLNSAAVHAVPLGKPDPVVPSHSA